jgi:hypothetical protein
MITVSEGMKCYMTRCNELSINVRTKEEICTILGFEVLTAVSMKIAVFWVVAGRSP